jgi:chromatin assembly factor 1 subunit A
MPSQKSPGTPQKAQPSPARQESINSQSIDGDVVMTSPIPQSPQPSDYRKVFLAFQLKQHTKCAPYIPLLEDSEFKASQKQMDRILQRVAKNDTSTASPELSLSALFAKERKRSRGLWQPTAREVIESLHGSSQAPIDLTDELGEHYRPADLLDCLIVRHLHFGEDVRPAYFGTYSRKLTPSDASKLRKNPFRKLRQDTNYDYDSEAEWEEPEEGEDIGSDGEEDEESVGDAEEMDEFLDDEANDSKRHVITGDLKPVSTGLCWENEKGLLESSIQDSAVDLESMKIDFFIRKLFRILQAHGAALILASPRTTFDRPFLDYLLADHVKLSCSCAQGRRRSHTARRQDKATKNSSHGPLKHQ